MIEGRVGFGAHKLRPEDWATREELLRRRRAMLSRVLNLRTTVAFAGAGCSAPLGYPTWNEFTCLVVARTIEVLQTFPPCVNLTTDLKRLYAFRERLEAQQVEPSQFLFILGACQKMLQRRDSEAAYFSFLHELFQPRTPSPGVSNPYEDLLKFPIRRFVTSNYDSEIETALAKNRNIPRNEFEVGPKRVRAGAQ